MKKNIIYYLYFFYIHKKMNMQKTHEIKSNVFIIETRDKKRIG